MTTDGDEDDGCGSILGARGPQFHHFLQMNQSTCLDAEDDDVLRPYLKLVPNPSPPSRFFDITVENTIEMVDLTKEDVICIDLTEDSDLLASQPSGPKPREHEVHGGGGHQVRRRQEQRHQEVDAIRAKEKQELIEVAESQIRIVEEETNVLNDLMHVIATLK